MWMVTFLQQFLNAFSLERECGKNMINWTSFKALHDLSLSRIIVMVLRNECTIYLGILSVIWWLSSWKSVEIHSPPWELLNQEHHSWHPSQGTQMMFLEHQRNWIANAGIKLICTAPLRTLLSPQIENSAINWWHFLAIFAQCSTLQNHFFNLISSLINIASQHKGSLSQQKLVWVTSHPSLPLCANDVATPAKLNSNQIIKFKPCLKHSVYFQLKCQCT